MFLTQGWKRQPDGTMVVVAIDISPCTNGMNGWQMHVGCYDPARNQTIQHATWTFRCAAFTIETLLRGSITDEMLTWVDTQQGQDLKATLDKLIAAVQDLARRLPACPA